MRLRISGEEEKKLRIASNRLIVYKNELLPVFRRYLRGIYELTTPLEKRGLLAGIVEYQLREMAEDFGEMLMEVLKKYGREFDYETLFVRKPNMYSGLRGIAKGMKDRYGDEGAVMYWLKMRR